MGQSGQTYSVVVSADALSDEVIASLEALGELDGIALRVPVIVQGGSWTAAEGLSVRTAQALRRQFAAIGLQAEVEDPPNELETAPPTIRQPAVGHGPDELLELPPLDVQRFGKVDPPTHAQTPEELGWDPVFDADDPLTEPGRDIRTEQVLGWFAAQDEPEETPPSDQLEPAEPVSVPPDAAPSPEQEVFAQTAPSPQPSSRPAASADGLGAALGSVVSQFDSPGPRLPGVRQAPKKDHSATILAGFVLLVGLTALGVFAWTLMGEAEPESSAVEEVPADRSNTRELPTGVAGAKQAPSEHVDASEEPPDQESVDPESKPATLPSDRAEAQELYLEGVALCDLDRYDECAAMMEAVITLDPAHKEAYQLLVRAKAGPPEVKLPELEKPEKPKVIVITPDTPRPYDQQLRDAASSPGQPAGSAAAPSTAGGPPPPLQPGLGTPPAQRGFQSRGGKAALPQDDAKPSPGATSPLQDRPAGLMPINPDDLRKLEEDSAQAASSGRDG